MKPELKNTRSFRLERGTKGEDGLIPIALSSEAEVGRGWYIEVLSHEPGAVVMERAASGLPFLVNHDTDRLAGRIEDVRLEDRKLRGSVRFGSSALGQEIARDVEDGIRPDISVGYIIHDYREEKRDGQLYVIATLWEPLEGSSVPIPADAKGAGVGRSLDPATPGNTPGDTRANPNPPAAPAGMSRKEGLNMTPEELAALQRAADEKAAQRVADSLKEGRSSGITEALEAMELAKRAGFEADAASMLRDGKGAGEIRAMLLNQIIERGANPFKAPPVVLTPKEEKSFSIARAIMAQATGARCFEREVSDELAKKLGREAAGIYVPTYLQQQRALDATVTATAKGLISQENVTFIELLRNQTAVMQAGATCMPGCVGNIPFARQNVAGAATWTGDNPVTPVSNSDPGVEVFNMTPKQLMAKRTYSKQLLAQTSGFADTFVTQDLAEAHSLELDRAALFGSGSTNQPLGLIGMTGVGAVIGGTNGLAPLWAQVVGLETAVATANALKGTLAYITNTKGRGYFKQVLRAAAAGSSFIWADDDTMNGYKAFATGQVPSNLTKGSANNCSAMFFGNWRELLIAEWGALDLTVDPYSLADSGLIRVISLQLADVNARHTQSFSTMLDALFG